MEFKCISGELCRFFPVTLLCVTGPFHFRMWRVYYRWGSSSGGWSPLQEAWARGWGQREVKTVLTWHIPEEFPWVSKSFRLEEEDWSDSGLGDDLTKPSWWPVVSGEPCVFWGNYGSAEDTTKLTPRQLLRRSTQIPLTKTKGWWGRFECQTGSLSRNWFDFCTLQNCKTVKYKTINVSY